MQGKTVQSPTSLNITIFYFTAVFFLTGLKKVNWESGFVDYPYYIVILLNY